MRMLMIAATPFFADRGSHIRIYEEARALQRQGVTVRIVTYPLGYTPVGVEVVRSWGLPWYKRTAVGSSGKGLFDWKILLDLFMIVVSWWQMWRFRPTVVYCHGHESLCIGWVARLLYFRQTVLALDAQGSLVAELTSYGTINARSLATRLYRWAESFSYRISEHIFVSSPNSQTFIQQEYPLQAHKVTVIKDSYHSQVHPVDEKEKRQARRALKIAPSAHVLLYTGSFTESKGFPSFWKQIPKLLEKHRKLVVVVAGYPGAASLDQEKSSWKVGKQVYIIDSPRYADLPSILATANVTIDPKNNSTEASGKTINYMAAGLPVIAFDNDANRELLGNEGWYISDWKDLNRLITKKVKKQYDYPFLHDHSWDASAAQICHTLLLHT